MTNKTQAVIDFLDNNPGATAKTVIPALKKQKITVSAGLINNVRSRLKNRNIKKAVADNGEDTPDLHEDIPTSDLFIAKKAAALFDHDFTRAQTALSTLCDLRDLS